MVHIKNILADCNGDLKVARSAIKLCAELSDPIKRLDTAIYFAKLINSSKKKKQL